MLGLGSSQPVRGRRDSSSSSLFSPSEPSLQAARPFPAVSESACSHAPPHTSPDCLLRPAPSLGQLRARVVSHSWCLLSTLCTLAIAPGLSSLPASLLTAKKAFKSPLFRRERLSLLPFAPSSFRLSSLQSFAESQVSPKSEP